MAWSYDPTDLDTTTLSGRVNSTRLLIGDTDTSDQQVQNEEIEFALAQNSNNVYSAASWSCKIIAAKYSRLVTTQLDGVLQSDYSDRIKNYSLLAIQIEALGRKTSGNALGVFAGGISNAEISRVEQLDDRPKPAFTKDQFGYLPDLYYGEY